MQYQCQGALWHASRVSANVLAILMHDSGQNCTQFHGQFELLQPQLPVMVLACASHVYRLLKVQLPDKLQCDSVFKDVLKC